MRDLRTSNWGQRCWDLGYILQMDIVDSMGRQRKYRTGPCCGGGTINYFDSLADLAAWVREVSKMRNIDRYVEMYTDR